MDTMGERLTYARTKAGFGTAKEACDAFGWTYSTYVGHENGLRGYPLSKARIYGAAFKVGWDWLMTGAGEPGPVSGEKKVLRGYRSLDPADQTIVEGLIDQLSKRKREPRK
jgi:hypothetical protein